MILEYKTVNHTRHQPTERSKLYKEGRVEERKKKKERSVKLVWLWLVAYQNGFFFCLGEVVDQSESTRLHEATNLIGLIRNA